MFAIDMRGYADSDPADSERSFIVDTGFGWETVFDFGMVLDVVNSLRLLRDGAIPAVDPSRIGLLGHSMGGMLAIDAAVVAPGLADQVVAAAAAGSDFPSMIADAPDGGAAFADAYRKFGTPEQNRGYWADISARTFFDRATEPLFLVHGGADPATSPTWSLDTAKAWRDAGGTADTLIIDGADHHFNPKRSTADTAIVAAFDAVLKAQG